MYQATFCTKHKYIGSLEEHLGTTLFYLYDKYYAYECVISFFPPSTGFDQSARGLTALHYVWCFLQSDK